MNKKLANNSIAAGVLLACSNAYSNSITNPDQYLVPTEVFTQARGILLALDVEEARNKLTSALTQVDVLVKTLHKSAINESRNVLQRTYELKQGLALEQSTGAYGSSNAHYCLGLTSVPIAPFASLEERDFRKELLDTCSLELKNAHDDKSVLSQEQLLFNLGDMQVLGFSPSAQKLMVADYNDLRVKVLSIRPVYEEVSRIDIQGQVVNEGIWNKVVNTFPDIDIIGFQYCNDCTAEITVTAKSLLKEKLTVIPLEHFMSNSNLALSVKYQLAKQ